MPKLLLLASLALIAGCDLPVGNESIDGQLTGPEVVELDLASALDAQGFGSAGVQVALEPGETVLVNLDVGPAVREVTLERVAIGFGSQLGTALITEDGAPYAYRAPRSGLTQFRIQSTDALAQNFSLTARGWGPEVVEVRPERSLVWTDPELLEDVSLLGFSRFFQVLRGDSGFASLMRELAGNSSSSHAAGLLAAMETEQGSDPTKWDLDLAPFKPTGIHIRLERGTYDPRRGEVPPCGQIRISFASTHPTYQPFHLTFVYRLDSRPGDAGPACTAGPMTCGGSPPPPPSCAETLHRWRMLSSFTDAEFVDEARSRINQLPLATPFLIESIEQNPAAPHVRIRSNAPTLFNQLDAARLNQAGELRDRFLTWTAASAHLLDRRELLIPEEFRAPLVDLFEDVPAPHLNLHGLDATVAANYPKLREKLEAVGCTGCHSAEHGFLHSRPDRTFSPFFEKELAARKLMMETALERLPTVPFGPLQPLPDLEP